MLGLSALGDGACLGAARGPAGRGGCAGRPPGAEPPCLRRARRSLSLSAEAWCRVTWPAPDSFASPSTSGTPVCTIQGHAPVISVTMRDMPALCPH